MPPTNGPSDDSDPTASQDEAALTAIAQSADKAAARRAFLALVAQHQPYLTRYLRSQLGSHAGSASDLFQDVVLRWWKRFRRKPVVTLEPGHSLLPYAHTIAERVLAWFWMRQPTASVVPLDDVVATNPTSLPSTTTWDDLTSDDAVCRRARELLSPQCRRFDDTFYTLLDGARLMQAATAPPQSGIAGLFPVLDAIARLGPRQRDCVLLRFYFGLTTEEVAALLHVSEATVRWHIRFAKTRLHVLLGRTAQSDGAAPAEIPADILLDMVGAIGSDMASDTGSDMASALDREKSAVELREQRDGGTAGDPGRST
jgi:DNA-directed RNA polymerase specialized sigma24 family protein